MRALLAALLLLAFRSRSGRRCSMTPLIRCSRTERTSARNMWSSVPDRRVRGVVGTRLEFEGQLPGTAEVMRGARSTRHQYRRHRAAAARTRRGNTTESVRAAQKRQPLLITVSNPGCPRRDAKFQVARSSSCSISNCRASPAPAPTSRPPAGTQLTALYPRTGQKATFTAKRVDGGTARHRGGTDRRRDRAHSLDANGRVDHMDLPQAGIVVTKLPS